MAELMKVTNGILFWDVRFFRDCHVRDLDAVSSFMVTIYGSLVREFGEDKMCCKTDRSKGFMVKNYYSLLAGSIDFFFSMKKHLATENPYLSSFLCLDCYFGKMLDNRQFEKKGRFGYWIGVICASVMVNRLTIFFFIAQLLRICGLWFLVYLE